MYLHLYNGSPTAGGVDGTQASEGNNSNPITIEALNAATNQISDIITLAVRAESGYETSGNTTISISGTTIDKWQLSLDGVTWLDWGASLVITSVITIVNTLFYVRAKAVSGENPVNDVSADLKITGLIVAV